MIAYLCSPYSSVDPDVRAARWRAACRAAAILMSQGHIVFSPIAHSHPIAESGKLPTSWEFWAAQDLEVLGHCGKLLVLRIDGWSSSVGVRAEMDAATLRGIPIEYVDIDELAGQNLAALARSGGSEGESRGP